MPSRDTLFVLRPGFEDKGHTWFCPYSAQVIGMLTYYPEIRETLELVEIEFPRPRQAIVALIGEANQSSPVLVLGDGAAVPADIDVKVGEAGGNRFISKTIEILRYLAATRGVPLPH